MQQFHEPHSIRNNPTIQNLTLRTFRIQSNFDSRLYFVTFEYEHDRRHWQFIQFFFYFFFSFSQTNNCLVFFEFVLHLELYTLLYPFCLLRNSESSSIPKHSQTINTYVLLTISQYVWLATKLCITVSDHSAKRANAQKRRIQTK